MNIQAAVSTLSSAVHNKSKTDISVQAKQNYVTEYQASGESMVAFCKKHSFVLKTFKNWVTRYGEKKTCADFIPMLVEKASVAPTVSSPRQRLEIQKGDMTLIFPDVVNSDTVIRVIKGVMLCS